MAEATKSVLFVDYDSIHRSLAARDGATAGRLAPRVTAWVAAIEAGKIFAKNSGGGRRRILMRRCYADPSLLGGERSSFLSNGFQVIDCPPAEGRERNAAAIHMVLDTIDALEHPADYEEFILLSADTDLSPVLIRLRAHNRLTAIYANAATAESYKAITDAMVDEQRLVSIVLSDEAVTDSEPAAQPAERSEVESLARKISGATNVPLFAPRTFAELFRHLVDEISENGYHFQTTAENVAARMSTAGRNVTRRQVVFVVKGLALKGHVFSTSDTPERLAEVFREQVVYLAENAGIELDKSQKSVLASWIIGRVAAGSATGSEEVEIAAVAGAGARESVKPETKSGSSRSSRSSRRRPSKAAEPVKSETAAAPPSVTQTAPASEPPKSDIEPGTRAAPVPPAPPVPTRALAVPPKPLPAPTRQTFGTRPASSLAGPPGTRPAATSPMRTPPVSRPATRLPTSDADKEKVESSILAAIAQAVDVLVDDDGPKAKGAARSGEPRDAPPEERDAPTERTSQPPQAAEGNAPEGDDIGDEIQRIIASYNRKRDRNG